MRNIKCDRCQKEFICKGADYNCWCFEKPYVNIEKTENYNDCLCEQCLIDIHNESKNNNP